LFFLWPLCCIADHCLSILSCFSFAHCAVLLITVCICCPVFPLAIVLYCWSLFVYFVLLFLFTAQWAKKKKGQNRQTVISNTAQWPKEKKDKIDKQWSAIQHNGQRKNRTK
jgi:hypothetical protein